jgi:integrase/recombinase XerD
MEKQLLAFLDFLQQEYKYSANTTAAYKNDLNQFMNYLRKVHAEALNGWNDVTIDVVDSYVEYMKAQPYASSSIARKVAAIKSFFNYMFARGIITANPTAKVDSPKVQKRLPHILDKEDVKQLLRAPAQRTTPKHLRDTALLTMLYATGMRVTEIVSLRLEDIDLENSLLYCPGKEDQVRELPFDESTAKILGDYLENGRPYLVKDREQAETAVFLNHRGQQLTRQGLWLIIKAYAKQAKLDVDVTPHTLRHSFAAHKIEGGIDLQEVQRLLGHANISTTQIYTQIESEENGESLH